MIKPEQRSNKLDRNTDFCPLGNRRGIFLPGRTNHLSFSSFLRTLEESYVRRYDIPLKNGIYCVRCMAMNDSFVSLIRFLFEL